MDDTDSSIVYDSTWQVVSADTPVFGTTTHETWFTNAIASISFQGSYITVFGTVPSITDASGININISASHYSIDGKSPVTFNASLASDRIRNQVLFQPVADLSDGQHTLVITNDIGVLYLDYVTIVPSAVNASSRTSPQQQMIKVDDTSPLMTYTGSAQAPGTQADYQSTLRNVSSPGATTSLTFTGTYVAVYGALPPSNSTASPLPDLQFKLDSTVQLFSGAKGDARTPPLPIVRNKTIHQALLWQSSTLDDGKHTLEITTQQDNQGPFLLDFVLVQSSSPQSTNAAQTQPQANTSQLDKTAIVGGVLGGLIFILLLVIIVPRARRWHPAKHASLVPFRWPVYHPAHRGSMAVSEGNTPVTGDSSIAYHVNENHRPARYSTSGTSVTGFLSPPPVYRATEDCCTNEPREEGNVIY